MTGILEAGAGIEPAHEAFAEPRLPTWLPRRWMVFRNAGRTRIHLPARPALPVCVVACSPTGRSRREMDGMARRTARPDPSRARRCQVKRRAVRAAKLEKHREKKVHAGKKRHAVALVRARPARGFRSGCLIAEAPGHRERLRKRLGRPLPGGSGKIKTRCDHGWNCEAPGRAAIDSSGLVNIAGDGRGAEGAPAGRRWRRSLVGIAGKNDAPGGAEIRLWPPGSGRRSSRSRR